MKHLIILFSVTTFFSCNKSIVKSYQSNTEIKKGYGIMLCSITLKKANYYYTGYYLQLKDDGTDKQYGFGFNRHSEYQGVKRYQPGDSLKIYYMAKVLPVGKYRICNFLLDQTVAGNGWVSKCREDFSIPFEVYENKVNYIGNYTCIPFSKETFIGKRFLSGRLFTSGRLVEDAAFIRQSYKSFDYNDIVDQTPGKDNIIIGNPCIVVL